MFFFEKFWDFLLNPLKKHMIFFLVFLRRTFVGIAFDFVILNFFLVVGRCSVWDG